MALYTGCIYTNHHRGTRISLASNHTSGIAVIPDQQGQWCVQPSSNGLVTPDQYDEWWVSLAPPHYLARDYVLPLP